VTPRHKRPHAGYRREISRARPTERRDRDKDYPRRAAFHLSPMPRRITTALRPCMESAVSAMADGWWAYSSGAPPRRPVSPRWSVGSRTPSGTGTHEKSGW